MATVHLGRPLTELLSEEHGLIGRGLDLFVRYAEQVRSGDYDPALARPFLRFFREFADQAHHAKEEEILFRWLEERGLPREVGPLAVMRHEHELGRDLRLALSLAADVLVETPGDAETRERFHALVQRYVELMVAHIEKEENVLFPLAQRFGRQLGEQCVHPGTLPEEELAWIVELEARAGSWPRAHLAESGLGTPRGFERLCEEALG